MAGEVDGIVIDALREEDIPRAAEIEGLSFTTPWSETLFFNELKNPRCVALAARGPQGLEGYVCGALVIDEGHIHNLAVSPGLRGRGIASALVKHLTAVLKEQGARFIFLEVRDSNEAAKSLYRTFGFEVIGTRKDYYVSPVEHAVIMRLRLTD